MVFCDMLTQLQMAASSQRGCEAHNTSQLLMKSDGTVPAGCPSGQQLSCRDG